MAGGADGRACRAAGPHGGAAMTGNALAATLAALELLEAGQARLGI